MTVINEDRWEQADTAIERAADEIIAVVTKRIDRLLRSTSRHPQVARDYVIERLIEALLDRDRDHALQAFLGKDWRGEASVRLSEALLDWRDRWALR